MRVIVVGAGIGGLAAALMLGRAGIDVSLFEQASELREVGAGIMTSPNANRILHRLGLEEPLRRIWRAPARETVAPMGRRAGTRNRPTGWGVRARLRCSLL